MRTALTVFLVLVALLLCAAWLRARPQVLQPIKAPSAASDVAPPPSLPTRIDLHSGVTVARVDTVSQHTELWISNVDEVESENPWRSQTPWVGDRILSAYVRLHAAILRADSSAPKRRFVVWKPVGHNYQIAGLANHVIGAVSVLLFAILTQRAFLVDDPKFSQHFLLPHAVDWQYRLDSTELERHPMRHHKIQNLNVDELLACQDLNAAFPEAVVSMETTQYFAPLLTHNPRYRTALVRAFGPALQLFPPLFQFAFRVQPEFVALVDQFVALHLRGAYSVGMQMRMEHLANFEMDEGFFHQCAQMLAVRRLSALADAAASFSSSSSAASSPATLPRIVIVLATDSSDIARRARNFFTTAASELWGVANITFVRYGGFATPAQAVMMDLLLLARADDYILTLPRSTFGMVAVGLSGRVPYALLSHEARRGECVRFLGVEPCYHGWFRRRSLTCYNAAAFETHEMLNCDNGYNCDRPHCCRTCTQNIPSDVTCPLGKCVMDDEEADALRWELLVYGAVCVVVVAVLLWRVLRRRAAQARSSNHLHNPAR